MPLLPRLRGLPSAYWVLFAGALVNRIGGFVVPFLSLYLTRERGLSMEAAGLVVSLFGLGAFAAGPLGGALADRVGRRPTLLLALFGGAAAMIHLGLARAPWHVGVAAALLGLLGELYRPAMQAAVSDVVPPEDRPRAFGFTYWAVNVGFSIAPVLAGLLARRGNLALFAGDALTTALFGVIVAAKLRETRPRRPEGAPPRDLAAPYRDRAFLGFVAVQLAVALVFQQAFVTLPVDLGAHGVSPERYGMLIAVNGAIIVLLQPVAIALVGRARRTTVLAAGALLTGIGFGVNALVATTGGYLVGIALWTLGEMAFAPVTPTIIAELSPPELRGSYQGAFQVSWGLSSLVGPAIGMLVLGRLGAAALWGGCFAIGVACAIAHVVAARVRAGRGGPAEAGSAGA